MTDEIREQNLRTAFWLVQAANHQQASLAAMQQAIVNHKAVLLDACPGMDDEALGKEFARIGAELQRTAEAERKREESRILLPGSLRVVK